MKKTFRPFDSRLPDPTEYFAKQAAEDSKPEWRKNPLQLLARGALFVLGAYVAAIWLFSLMPAPQHSSAGEAVYLSTNNADLTGFVKNSIAK